MGDPGKVGKPGKRGETGRRGAIGEKGEPGVATTGTVEKYEFSLRTFSWLSFFSR